MNKCVSVCTHHSCFHCTLPPKPPHTQHVHVQQQAPKAVQEQCGCVIGRDYPFPIVEHAEASKVILNVCACQLDGWWEPRTCTRLDA